MRNEVDLPRDFSKIAAPLSQPRPKIILVTSPPLPPLLGLCVLGRWAVEVFSFFMKITAIGGGGVWGWQMSS